MRFNLKYFKIKKPKLSFPKIPSLNLKWPAFSMPAVNVAWPKLPRLRLPHINLPRIQFTKIEWPTLRIPEYNLPAIKLPAIALPNLNVKIPDFKKPIWAERVSLENAKTFVVTAICIVVLGAMFIDVMHTNTLRAAGFSAVDFIKNVQVEQNAQAADYNALMPAAASDEDLQQQETLLSRYEVEEEILNVEAVLIPRDVTVISSSQDSKIKTINFDNGERFKRGDILVEYACKDVRAEVAIAKTQQELTEQKSDTSHQLFKLDIISNLERLELESENKQAEARIDLYQSRMENCFIRAEYDGRVVKRLANAGEFTRTDRVLLEIASLDYLKAEFLLPSRWLRWVDIGAPIELRINETDKTYPAVIKYIYGEVDPISQSIQVTAQMEPYNDPLLPGMSGQATIDISAVRDAGIYGFLEREPDENLHER